MQKNERETVHVMDDQRRVLMIETATKDNDGATITTPTPRFRYQLDNHLGTACVEVSDDGSLISYEEYHPFGSTSWHARDAAIEVSAKRYRYTGKEKDDETGLYYHGARYYAGWLGRWTAADPSGGHRYAYCSNRPIVMHDPDGREEAPAPSLWENWKAGVGGVLDSVANTASMTKLGASTLWNDRGMVGTVIKEGVAAAVGDATAPHRAIASAVASGDVSGAVSAYGAGIKKGATAAVAGMAAPANLVVLAAP